jgi:hypothetical protein
VADRRLIETQQVRLLRRIVRDSRHRGAHALATLDYWPMIVSSERHYFAEYLANADFYVNSMLSYESLVIAPLALQDIRNAMESYEKGDLKPSVFMNIRFLRSPLPISLKPSPWQINCFTIFRGFPRRRFKSYLPTRY